LEKWGFTPATEFSFSTRFWGKGGGVLIAAAGAGLLFSNDSISRYLFSTPPSFVKGPVLSLTKEKGVRGIDLEINLNESAEGYRE